jgi:uncharacterized damage-inducible protein DinB
MATIHLTFDELLAYTDEEREKWQPWFAARRSALAAPLQPGGRFPTVFSLLDHIFLVEARHLARLERAPIPAQSGVAHGDLEGLFAYAAAVRARLQAFAASLGDEDASTARTFEVQSGAFTMTPRKLLLHIAVHETRHWAQIALAVRQTGLEPPGEHDLFYCRALA